VDVVAVTVLFGWNRGLKRRISTNPEDGMEKTGASVRRRQEENAKEYCASIYLPSVKEKLMFILTNTNNHPNKVMTTQAQRRNSISLQQRKQWLKKMAM